MSLDRHHYEALAGFRRALRRFLAYSENLAHEAGVTTQQYQAMLAIKAHAEPEMLVRDLADQMLLKHNGAVQLVDRLAHAGLVARSASPADRRTVRLALTARGEAVLADLAAKHVQGLLEQEALLADSLRRLRGVGA